MSKRSDLLCVLSFVVGVTILHIASWTKASAQDRRCRVADPTGTPLNVRTAPNGKIVETLSNGVLVAALDYSSSQGKMWVFVGRAGDRAPLGWVFRDYLDCGSDVKAESAKKILISSHYGSGTIISMSEINTEHARLTYTRAIDNSEEGCSREMGLVDESGHIRRTPKFDQCVRNDLWHGRVETRRANLYFQHRVS